MLPTSAEIANGNVDMTGTSPADKLQGTSGCIVTKGSTGLCSVQLSAPNDGLGSSDLIVQHNPGFGTSKSGGGMSTTMSSYSGGSFIFTLWDQSVVPPVAIDGNIHFVIKRKYSGT